MVVAAPAVGQLEGRPPGDQRARGHELVGDLAVDALGDKLRDSGGAGGGTCHRPLVEAVAAIAEAIARTLVGSGDEPIE